jgi:hypothetical protein
MPRGAGQGRRKKVQKRKEEAHVYFFVVLFGSGPTHCTFLVYLLVFSSSLHSKQPPPIQADGGGGEEPKNDSNTAWVSFKIFSCRTEEFQKPNKRYGIIELKTPILFREKQVSW